jgi:hypothetical protein
MSIGILKILDFQAPAKRRRDELCYYFRWEMVLYTKATSNFNFLLWPKVYLLGIPKKAGAVPVHRKK